MAASLWQTRCVKIWSLIVVSLTIFIVDEQTMAYNDPSRRHNRFPMMNASWCLDLGENCPREWRSDLRFTKILTDFCLDRCYGFMGVKDAGVDEEKARAEFTGPRNYTDLQIDRIAEAVADALAENDNTKKTFLKNPSFYCPIREEDRCYWKVYKIFSLMCLDPLLNHHANLYKHIFVHACEADWLDLRKIATIMKKTCAKKQDLMMDYGSEH